MLYMHLSFPGIVDRRSRNFDLRTSLISDEGRYVVLMFVGTRGTREIEYQIIERTQQASTRVAILTAKGKYISGEFNELHSKIKTKRLF